MEITNEQILNAFEVLPELFALKASEIPARLSVRFARLADNIRKEAAPLLGAKIALLRKYEGVEKDGRITPPADPIKAAAFLKEWGDLLADKITRGWEMVSLPESQFTLTVYALTNLLPFVSIIETEETKK